MLTVAIAFMLYSRVWMWFCSFWISDFAGSSPFCCIGPVQTTNNMLSSLCSTAYTCIIYTKIQKCLFLLHVDEQAN